MKKWLIASRKKFSAGREVHKEIIKELLRLRGIRGKKAIDKFLNPDLKEATWKNAGIDEKQLLKASSRIQNAIKEKEQMVVYTDYDVDGITSGAIIWETIHDLGGKIMPFVPHRVTEGYGLSRSGIDKIIEQHHPKLILTVDHGISAIDEVEYAKKKGLDVIIIDHHLPPVKLPKASSIVHTTKLAAAGVCLMFAVFLYEQILGKERAEHKLETFLDLVTLATIADLVPLTGMNRSLVKRGLETLKNSKRVGLQALIVSAGLEKGKIDTYSVSHYLAPRLNATGRILHGLDSLRLICTRDRERARELAEKINTINRDRQILTDDHTAMALKTLNLELSVNGNLGKLIFVESQNYNQGIIGLIAGKLVEQYHRPAIVVSVGEELCKASARSITGVNIVELLRRTSKLLVSVGGHPMAAGFTVRRGNLAELKQSLITLSQEVILNKSMEETLAIDSVLDLSLVDHNLLACLESLSPFGIGNPQPVFASFSAEVAGYSRLGKEQKHLKLLVKQNSGFIEAIAFNFADLVPSLSPGVRLDLAFTVNRDSWKGRDNLILKLKDARVAAAI